MKSITRKLFRQRQEVGKLLAASKRDACQDFVRAWESISYYNISQAWNIYTEEFDPDDCPAEVEMKNHHRQMTQKIRREKRVNPIDDDDYKGFDI